MHSTSGLMLGSTARVDSLETGGLHVVLIQSRDDELLDRGRHPVYSKNSNHQKLLEGGECLSPPSWQVCPLQTVEVVVPGLPSLEGAGAQAAALRDALVMRAAAYTCTRGRSRFFPNAPRCSSTRTYTNTPRAAALSSRPSPT